jgi:DegV family protein with EDD domain
MAKVRIVTDTCASIPDELLVALQIVTVPYYVNIEGRSYRDLVDMPRGQFYEYLTQARELPKTANPGPGEYLAAYQQAAAEGATAIVSIQMTSSGSGGYQAACLGRDLARAELPGVPIEVVDTRNVAMCQGWIALEAARAAATDASLEQVMALIADLLPRTRILQTADTLRYLYMGGRIGRAQHLVGQLLNVKPLISMEDGVIVALGVARSRLGAYRQIVERVVAAAGRQWQVKVAYLHAAAEGEAHTLRGMLEERLRPVESLVAELSPALGVHSGPGTVGICYLRV